MEPSASHRDATGGPPWRRYEHCRPDEVAALLARRPVAVWPLGMIEHHGWHLPVGYDALKAERICLRLVRRTGGLLLPTLWWGWGGDGGHGDFLWTHYRSHDVSGTIIREAVQQLVRFGVRAVVALAGHGPFHEILEAAKADLSARHPGVLFLFGLEIDIVGEVGLSMDHAAVEETSLGLELLPEFVDMEALTPGRDPAGQWPADLERLPSFPQYPGFDLDPASPLFSQFGGDARQASAQRVAAGVQRLIDTLAARVDAHLGAAAPPA